MEVSSLLLMTCEELRDHFSKCPDDINKRVLIIDVRSEGSYEKSHLCLDSRHRNISSITTKMRVMNINPDKVEACTAKNLMSILNEEDLKVFKRRKHATEVVIIDNNTDDISQLSNPKSKVKRMINALTRYDNMQDDKIIVPIHVLKGGFREWLCKYPHWTTDPTLDPDAQVSKSPPPDVRNNNILQPKVVDKDTVSHPVILSPVSPPMPSPLAAPVKPAPVPTRPSAPPSPHIHPQTPPKPAISKPIPIPSPKVVPSAPPPQPSAFKMNIVKNAPGTAVPVVPFLSPRPTLPRSHSSPNVAQAEGDEFDEPFGQFDKLNLSRDHPNSTAISINNNHITPAAPPVSKPRFDRTLKPSLNNEFVTAIRAQLNFGRSPEASGKAISGLQNLGNTCFMNSVIQCLAYAPALVSYFCSDSYYNHVNFNSQYGSKGELAIEFGALVEKLNAHRHRYIEPKSFRDSIIKHIGFAGNEQQDSHEFMMMLFDKLHHDLNTHAKEKFKQNGIVSQHANDRDDINIPRATLGYQFWRRHFEMNNSIISELFEGIFMSTLTCTYCKGQSNTFEVFNCLSLPIPSEVRCHLRDCLNHFSNPERIEAAWECSRCKEKREADKKIVICKLPRILIIHLKRFSLDGRWRQKLQTTVDFPLTDLRVDCTNVLPQSAYGSNPIKSSYNLCAVVNHYGHLDGGHYTAFCKLENQRWYTFDDSNVSEMKDTDVCGQAAYILFYSAT